MGALQRLAQRARQVSAAGTPDVPSPCVSICRMDPRTQWCEGCFRTLEEIAGWAGMDDEGKREVWRMIQARALGSAALSPAHSGTQSEERI
jgi:uncharacterized protein